jgi:hypothetical protein
VCLPFVHVSLDFLLVVSGAPVGSGNAMDAYIHQNAKVYSVFVKCMADDKHGVVPIHSFVSQSPGSGL